MKHKPLLIIIISCSFGYNVVANLANIDSFDIDQWQGLYNSIAGARSDAPDYNGAEKDNIALNSYNDLQQNYESVVSNHGTSLDNIANDESTSVSTGENWIPQTEPQNIGTPDVNQLTTAVEDSSYQVSQPPVHAETSPFVKYYPVVKTVVVPVEKIVNYEVEKLISTPVQRPSPYVVEKYILQGEYFDYPVHVPVYRHTYYRVPSSKDQDEHKNKNIDRRRSFRRRRNYPYVRRPISRYRFHRIR